jgi:hypothetical protein
MSAHGQGDEEPAGPVEELLVDFTGQGFGQATCGHGDVSDLFVHDAVDVPAAQHPGFDGRVGGAGQAVEGVDPAPAFDLAGQVEDGLLCFVRLPIG